MTKHIPFERSYFVALWIQTLIYGAYVVLFFGCMYILLFRRAVPCSKFIHISVVVLFVLSTAHVIINFVKNVRAWTVVASPSDIFAAFKSPIDLAKESVYVTTAALADSVLIYRCWMVWGHNWRVIVLPSMLLMLGVAAGYISVYQFSVLNSEDGAQFEDNLGRWFKCFYAAMLSNNTLTTILIASRIWWISRSSGSALGGRHQAKYHFVIAVVIESGALYAMSLLIYLVLYSIESQAQKLLLDSLCQIAAIMPTLIVVRIGLGMNPYDLSTTFQSTANSIQFKGRLAKPTSTGTGTVNSSGDRGWTRNSLVDINRMAAVHHGDTSTQTFALHPSKVDEGNGIKSVV